MSIDIKPIASQFAIYGDFVKAAPYGSGHINDTFCAEFDQAGTPVRYILQRLSPVAFKKPVELMENVQRVTEHAQRMLAEAGDPEATRKALTVIMAKDGKPYVIDADGGFWRAYLFIEKAQTYDLIEKTEWAFEAAKAFGEFQKLLKDLPGERLHETIPNFHHTRERFNTLKAAIEADTHGRAEKVQAEIDFALSREAMVDVLLDLQAEGKIPERVTHNDTKLNNVMLDDKSGKGVCVIDLDTTMPGLALYDFGDMVRTACNSAAEDEMDLTKVFARRDMFETLVSGYLSSAGDFLNDVEKAHLVHSGKLLSFECGIRFLTDYLQGDVYFKIKRENHNIDRCRTQFRLVESIEDQADEWQAFVDSQCK